MEIGKKGSIGFIIGGALAIMSSTESTGQFVIPEQVKFIGGVGLIIFGFTRLLFVYENEDEQRKNRKTALLIASILMICFFTYFYFREPQKKEYLKTYGVFNVLLNNRSCSGEIIFEGDELTFQIRNVPPNVEINGLTLYNRNIEIERRSILSVCALMSDLRLVRCSTDLDLPYGNFEMFLDKGVYTISYELKEPLNDINISDISFSILTDKGNLKVKIEDKK